LPYCVRAFGGADYVLTKSKDDFLMGGNGADYLNSDSGSDVIIGGEGADFIYGTGSKLEAYGGTGQDSIYANLTQSSELWGGGGADTLVGGPGPDFIAPGGGAANVSADAGNDTVQLFDACEAVSGLSLNGGAGSGDKLITPLSVSALQALGVTVSGFEIIVIDTSQRHLSPCFH
jgi:hypothetical protein